MEGDLWRKEEKFPLVTVLKFLVSDQTEEYL